MEKQARRGAVARATIRRRAAATEPKSAALVRAAYAKLAERGFEGLRTRDVAGEVGVNIATLHYYFPTKEALIRGIVGHAMGRFRSTLSGRGSAATQLRRHFRGLRRLAHEEPELFAVMGELALRARRDPAMATILRETDDLWHATLRGLLRRARKEGEIPDGHGEDDLAGLMVAALKGTYLLPAASQDSRRVEQTLRQLERAIGL